MKTKEKAGAPEGKPAEGLTSIEALRAAGEKLGRSFSKLDIELACRAMPIDRLPPIVGRQRRWGPEHLEWLVERLSRKA